VRELGISESVRFLGAVDDIAGLLAASDIGVHSSLSEGCPNSVLECMAAGLPVVGTDIDAMRDVVSPDTYPLLAPPRDPQALADVICRLADSPDLRADLGVGNLKRARDEFSPGRMCERMAEVMADAMNKRRPIGQCRA
jgi:glycosyltransferase involved in cell wall biosynthesis